ncbi:hypothetical protein DPMN_176304 [Dreissena polymorpha]|uniref:Uncharacterized protein n=1 Tax=Dreissena polymorpha TaxID=45954 RepID=A0A9D4E9A1_DREPO|nr:hypothetical protein DPMN_176304 [Dreissena polymorpha]
MGSQAWSQLTAKQWRTSSMVCSQISLCLALPLATWITMACPLSTLWAQFPLNCTISSIRCLPTMACPPGVTCPGYRALEPCHLTSQFPWALLCSSLGHRIICQEISAWVHMAPVCSLVCPIGPHSQGSIHNNSDPSPDRPRSRSHRVCPHNGLRRLPRTIQGTRRTAAGTCRSGSQMRT